MSSILTPTGSRQVFVPAFPDPIPGIIGFGTVNILAGASGVGKTCLLAYLLSRLQQGLPVFGTPVQAPPAIGFISADRGSATAQHWFTLAGLEIPIYNLVEDLTFVPGTLRHKLQLITLLEKMIRTLGLPPGSIVSVDPVTLFMGNTNDYQGCAIACIELRRMCQRLQLTLLGTAHAGKQKADAKSQYTRLQDRILGSAAQLGYGDTQMYLAGPEETDEAFYSFLWHPHTAPPQIFKLGRDATGMFIPWKDTVQVKELSHVLTFVTAEEVGTALQAIITSSGLSKATVHRHLNDLIAAGQILRLEQGMYRRAAVN